MGVGQGVFDCVRGRERETKKAGRERVRGRGGEKMKGRCMRESRDIVRGRGRGMEDREI